MSDLCKAVCNCGGKEEQEVTAIKYDYFQDWGFGAWTFNILMLLFTGFFWVGFMIMWGLINYPRYRCQNCNEEIEEKNLRL